MQLWQDGLVTILAAVGVVNLLWGMVQAMSAMGRPKARQALAVVAASGDGSGVEEQVLSLTGLGQSRGTIGRILVVNCGLTDEGQKLCAILARENRWVILCKPEQIANIITQQI